MTRELVSSSNIRAVGYDNEHSTLEVEFNSGTVYQYQGVPEDVFNALKTAESVGKYFNRNIKGTYEFTRIS